MKIKLKIKSFYDIMLSWDLLKKIPYAQRPSDYNVYYVSQRVFPFIYKKISPYFGLYEQAVEWMNKYPESYQEYQKDMLAQKDTRIIYIEQKSSKNNDKSGRLSLSENKNESIDNIRSSR